jgi:hypothetical protein
VLLLLLLRVLLLLLPPPPPPLLLLLMAAAFGCCLLLLQGRWWYPTDLVDPSRIFPAHQVEAHIGPVYNLELEGERSRLVESTLPFLTRPPAESLRLRVSLSLLSRSLAFSVLLSCPISLSFLSPVLCSP